MTKQGSGTAGRSIIEIIWEDLDRVMDLIKADGKPWRPTDKKRDFPLGWKDAEELIESWQDWGELRGQAQGLAYALAVLINPYKVDVPAVKKEALARWQNRQ